MKTHKHQNWRARRVTVAIVALIALMFGGACGGPTGTSLQPGPTPVVAATSVAAAGAAALAPTALPAVPATAVPTDAAGIRLPSTATTAPTRTPAPTPSVPATTAATAPTEQPFARPAEEIMACIPFPLTSKNIAPPLFFEDGPQPVWMYGKDEPVDQLEAHAGGWLEGYLAKNLPDDKAAQKAAIRRFISPEAKERVPDPRLRTALLAYTGTFAEPFIEYVLNGVHANGQPVLPHGIRFRRYEDNPMRGGSLQQNFTTGEAYIAINENLRFEDPRVLGALMVFELTHYPEPPGMLAKDAPINGTYEELMGAWLSGQYWAREVAKDPAVAGKLDAVSNTIGQVMDNGEAMLVINADGLFGDRGVKIIPGGKLTWTKYTDRFNLDDHRITVAPPVLSQVLTNLARKNAPPPPAEHFTLELLQWVDKNVDDATPVMLAAAQALGLDTSQPCAQR